MSIHIACRMVLAAALFTAFSSHAAESRPRYIFVNKAQGLCLDPAGFSAQSTADVNLYRCDEGLDQAFSLDTSGRLLNAVSGACLDAAGYQGNAGDRIGMYTCDGHADQTWTVPVVGGWTKITNKAKNYCLEAEQTGASGARLVLSACLSGETQLWSAMQIASIPYRNILINRAMGLCLDAAGADGGQGATLQVWSCDGELDQGFLTSADGRLTNAKSGRCVDIEGSQGDAGVRMQLWDCDNGTDQLWNLPTQGGWGEFKNKAKGLCLEATGDGGQGKSVQLSACSGDARQSWSFAQVSPDVPTDKMSYLFVNRESGLCLDPGGYDGRSTAPVSLYRCDGGLDQVFSMDSSGKLLNVKGGVCLDVAGFEGNALDKLSLYTCDGGRDQLWTLPSFGGWTRPTNQKKSLCLEAEGNASSGKPVQLQTCSDRANMTWTVLQLPH